GAASRDRQRLRFPVRDDRTQGFEAETRTKRFGGQYLARLNVSQAHVCTETKNEVRLVTLQRRFPDKCLEVAVEHRDNRLYVMLVDSAIGVVDADTLSRLASFDDDPARARIDVGERELGERTSAGLVGRMLFPNLADHLELHVACVAHRVAKS